MLVSMKAEFYADSLSVDKKNSKKLLKNLFTQKVWKNVVFQLLGMFVKNLATAFFGVVYFCKLFPSFQQI